MASSYRVGVWAHDLFGCFDDVSTCLSTLVCPCVMFGRTAETIGSGNCVICAVSLLVPPVNFVSRMIVRGRIRDSKGIDGSSVNDCLLILFCPFCSLVQEVQECQDMTPSAQSMCRT
ncbi:uncharacterized protein LOC123538356 [Mercenaria mercenaria]|uniref:uncharacterized protein LOC123538356 n=1 Tax=Mercenaria mercenaria TaxID=6596 RepID=UPI001E1D9EEC|nr:uncharacterized protein LOC123538356 [Mercenaria mercenaria]